MAAARCKDCGEPVRWSPRARQRLKDIRCPRCGGAVEAVTAGRTKPRFRVRCAACLQWTLVTQTKVLAVEVRADGHTTDVRYLSVHSGPGRCGDPTFREQILGAMPWERQVLLVAQHGSAKELGHDAETGA